MITLQPSDVFALLSAFGLYAFLRATSRRAKPYPPGPRPHWLLGNISDIPTTREAETYAEMAKTYGPLLHLQVFNKHLLIINDLSVADDLLSQRGSIYSDRPQFTMLGELMGWEWAPTLMPYGPRWRLHRRAFQSHLGQGTLSSHLQALQYRANVKLLVGLVHSPEEFMQHTHCAAAAGLLMMSYGIDIDKDSDYLTLCDAGVQSMVEAGVPGTYAVDWIGWLKYIPAWVPGAHFKRKARDWRRLSESMLLKPFEHAQAALLAGNPTSSWVADQLSSPNNTPLDENIVKASGVDTVMSYVNAAILALVLNPAAQERAYREILSVVGSDRLPFPEDRIALPFVEAFLLEVYRFYPPVPLGIPHCLMEDDMYNGCTIPKGTTVLGNIWAMLHDERAYEDPLQFNPDRFLSENGRLNPNAVDPRTAAFGFGRR
ncbi:cytochrome P450 [Auricularia subglabra TFB-10046 SS5]|uniref:Cytochrome P450 n=1 Tax=Auricularia subglabra (strain TFB-10046 / SS5) TaxID=717982 RepID=J0WWU1_AURST|nr:cytochrome P450 [Auricularia subglabra TFB-10046 SS5]